jgi:ribose transport system substrate-binding protein
VKRIYLGVLAASSLMIAGLAHGRAAGYDQTKLIRPITKTLTLIMIPKVVHPWYKPVQDGAQSAIAELKKEGITVKFIWDATPTADVDQQNRRIETDIGRHPDGLAVSCLDPATNSELLDEAIQHHINLLTFDTSCGGTYPFVGHRADEQDGRAMADFMGKKLNGTGEVGILNGSLTAPNHVARARGFKEEMAAKYPNIKIVFERPDNDNLQTAVTLTENALQAHPNLAGIYGVDASAPVGAARVVTSAGKAGKIVITGGGDLPETYPLIENGTIAAVTAQRQMEIGYWSVMYLVALNEGHTIPQDHDTTAFLMDKAFLDH